MVGVAIVLTALLLWLAVSLGGALSDPAMGTSVSSRFAEWARQHGGNSVVNWVENEWYSHHPPKVGGTPPRARSGAGRAAPDHVAGASTEPAISQFPPPSLPFASPAIPGEGQWSPAGRLVDGIPAVYETTLRPDAIHTSYVVGVAWMDTKLLEGHLVLGKPDSWRRTLHPHCPDPPSAATSLVAAFNAGLPHVRTPMVATTPTAAQSSRCAPERRPSWSTPTAPRP